MSAAPRSPPRSAHPRGSLALLLTAFLSAATVPALLSWTSHDQGRVLGNQREELRKLLAAGAEGRRESIPSRAVSGASAAELVRLPTGAGLSFKSELVFSDAQVDLFQKKSAREGEFGRALKPPGELSAKATRDGVEVIWAAPLDLEKLRTSLRDQPLLRLGFRVYRWREGEEPKLLTTFDAGQTAYRDRDLPLWQERFFYCVATVLEGTIGDLPTLIESKRSSVTTVETPEKFILAVLDGSDGPSGTPVRARLEIDAPVAGVERKSVVDVGPGERVRKSAADGDPIELDTGLVVKELRWRTGQVDTTVQRPEFLPDGRRKLDPASGLPSFRTETVAVSTRALVVELTERSGKTRTLESIVAPVR
jgi:hypothetical protein